MLLRTLTCIFAATTLIACTTNKRTNDSTKPSWAEINARYPRFTHARCEPVPVDTVAEKLRVPDPYPLPTVPLRFNLPSSGFATVLIMNLNHDVMDTLVTKSLDAGVYELRDFKPPATLMGFVVLEMNGETVSTQKVIFLR